MNFHKTTIKMKNKITNQIFLKATVILILVPLFLAKPIYGGAIPKSSITRFQRSVTRTVTGNALRNEYERRVVILRGRLKCGKPKERLVYLKDEHNHLTIDDNITWFPPAALLLKCEEGTGCCMHGKTCKMLTAEIVPVLFNRVDLVTGANTFESINFVNHTSCRCS